MGKLNGSAKGTRNFAPKEALRREDIVAKIKKIFRLYGFSPIETPSLARFDALTSKYTGGQEITKELFKLKDRGNRQLALRYDLTVPLAIFISQNLNFKFPFRAYQTASIWRDGPLKFGRYREFVQCDADIVGSSSMLADIEILALAKEIFNELNIPTKIIVNNRKFLNGLLKEFEVKQETLTKAITILDKIDKIPQKEIKLELTRILKREKVNKLFDLSNKPLSYFKKFKNKELQEGLDELKEIFKYAKILGFKLEFSPFLARGLDYYTNTVFEVFAEDFSSSVAAGGRYNKMISQLASQDLPAVGISFGLDTVYDAIMRKAKIDKEKPVRSPSRILIIPFSSKETEMAMRLLQKLRKKRINSEMAISKRLSKALEYANALAIPYAILIGPKEIQKKKFKIKDMKTGKEKLLTEKELVKKFTQQQSPFSTHFQSQKLFCQ